MSATRHLAIRFPIKNIGVSLVTKTNAVPTLQSPRLVNPMMLEEIREFRQKQIENLMAHNEDNKISPQNKIEINIFMDSIESSDTELKEFRQKQIQVLAYDQFLIKDLSDEEFQKMFFDEDGIVKTDNQKFLNPSGVPK